MNRDETSIGGSQAGFPQTAWSQILSAQDPKDPRHVEHINLLLKTYWRPVYAYIRAGWHKTIEDSKDLTQGFLAHVFEKGYIMHLTPERGSFRSYLKTALKHFLIDAARWDKRHSPATTILSIEASPTELEQIGPRARDESPEQAYDRTWVQSLLDSSLHELKQRLADEKKTAYFELFQAYCLDPNPTSVSTGENLADPPPNPSSPTYSEVAARFGLKEWDVRNHLVYCRHLLANIVRSRIRDYVASDQDIEAELAKVLEYRS